MPDPVAVNSMFARIARRYDVANRLLSGGVDLWWRRRLVAAVSRHAPRDVLDLATGSGDVAFALARRLPPTTPITGMDFCQPMLDEAELKKKAAGPARYAQVTFRQGDGLALMLNTPPSFHNPKSVLVTALPAVEPAQPPPLHPVDSKQNYCAEKNSLVLAVDGAPLVFSTGYAHGMTLRLQTKSGKPVAFDCVPNTGPMPT